MPQIETRKANLRTDNKLIRCPQRELTGIGQPGSHLLTMRFSAEEMAKPTETGPLGLIPNLEVNSGLFPNDGFVAERF